MSDNAETNALCIALAEAHETCSILAAERDELKEICDGMERGVIELAGENVKLAAERDALRAQLGTKTNPLKFSNGFYEALAGQRGERLTANAKTIAEQDQAMSKLHKTIEEQAAIIRRQQEEIERADGCVEAQINLMGEQAERAAAVINELKDQLRQARAACAPDEAEQERLRKELEEARADADTAKKAVYHCADQLSDALHRLDSMTESRDLWRQTADYMAALSRHS